MSIYKRGETWWIQYTDPDGRRILQSAQTKIKQEAKELHDRLKADAWRVKNLGARVRHTWQEAVIRWIKESQHKNSLKTDIELLRWLDPFLNTRYLDEITVETVKTIKQAKLDSGVKSGTVNRVMALLRAILNKAEREWLWLDKAPYIKMMPNKTKRIRWLTHAEAAKLLKELPDHLSAMMRFSLATGLRESNVVNLQWSQLDMQRRCAWIHADEAKGKKSIAIPLNADALQVIREQIGKHSLSVFTYKGEPVTRANNHAWRKALKRAGIESFRWHDLRHTWASWHVQNGTPLNILKELGGWSDIQMVLKYAHLSADHLSEYAENASRKNSKSETNLLQCQKTAK
ncbi:MAG: site-specific integrase [Methylomicrobium sp.]|nr:site-specific integrase [Methylomicrobium sp.]